MNIDNMTYNCCERLDRIIGGLCQNYHYKMGLRAIIGPIGVRALPLGIAVERSVHYFVTT
jgi:hypothetical protein